MSTRESSRAVLPRCWAGDFFAVHAAARVRRMHALLRLCHRVAKHSIRLDPNLPPQTRCPSCRTERKILLLDRGEIIMAHTRPWSNEADDLLGPTCHQLIRQLKLYPFDPPRKSLKASPLIPQSVR